MTAPATSPDASVHPRFRRRRTTIRRQARLRRLRRLGALTAIAAVALTGVVVLRSPVFDIDEIVITGTVRTGTDAVVSTSDLALGAPLLLADLGAAERHIETLPWVLDASVRRQLPGRVAIHVIERTASAVVAAPGVAVLVDDTGRVLGPVPAAGTGTYVTVVDDGDTIPSPGETLPEELALASRVAAELREPAGAVVAVRLRPEFHLQLAGGAVVRLGAQRQLDAKIDAFRTLWARVDKRCLSTIDLEVPTHPVLTRDPACS